MMSLQDLFYAPADEIHIVKPEKKEDVPKGTPKPPPPVPTILEENFGPFFPFDHPSPYTPPAAAAVKKPPETKKVDLKVPICCSECVDEITAELKELKGFKDVVCSIPKEKVTVTTSNDTKEDDILLVARRTRTFKKSRLWTKDD